MNLPCDVLAEAELAMNDDLTGFALVCKYVRDCSGKTFAVPTTIDDVLGREAEEVDQSPAVQQALLAASVPIVVVKK